MKTFSKALVLSVAMLVAGSAVAKNSTANDVATAIALDAETFKQDALFIGKNKKAYETAIAKYLSGKSNEAENVTLLAALTHVQKALSAKLAVNFTEATYKDLQRVNNLISRMTNDYRIVKAYRELVYKGGACKLEKREFRKIAAKAILDHKVQAAA